MAALDLGWDQNRQQEHADQSPSHNAQDSPLFLTRGKVTFSSGNEKAKTSRKHPQNTEIAEFAPCDTQHPQPMTYPLFELASSCARFALFRRPLALFLLCLGLCALGHAQNSRYDGIVWSRNGFPSPAASVDVCTQPASISSTAPYCTPLANLCSSATDAVCTSPNPVIADSMGNFHFYVKPGVYSLESYNSSLSPFLQADQVLACPPSAAPCSLVSLLLGDGTVSAPAYSWTNATTSGWHRAGSGDFRFSIGAVDALKLTSTQVIVPPTGMFGFGSSGVTSPDICFTRSAAGTAALGNCTASDGSGFLTLTQIISGTASGSTLVFSGNGLTSTLASGSGATNGGTFTSTAGNGGATGSGGGYSWTAGNGGATSGAAGSFVWNCGTVVSGTACGYQFLGGKITNYNSIATVSNGVPSEIATVDLTAQTAAITTTTLYAVPASGAGEYFLRWNAKVTTAAGVSSTLGVLTIVYTDPDGVAITITATAVNSGGTLAATNTANTTGTGLFGIPLLLNCKAGTNITYAFAYASNAANAMNYNLHIKLVAE